MNILVIGGAGGIGSALLVELKLRFPGASLYATWFTRPSVIEGVMWFQLDATDEAAVAKLAESLGELHWIINAAGFLHGENGMPEKSLSKIDIAFYMETVQKNVVPTLLVAQYFEKHLKHGDPAVFATISAKVGSIEDNRLGGWTSYRSAKAALNMVLKNLSIEWRRSHPNICVVALHPGTTDTNLSKPFQRNVPAKQLFSPEKTAQLLIAQLTALSSQQTGQFIAFDGERLPW